MANEKVPRAQDNVRDVKLESQSRPRRPSLMGRVEEILMCPESHASPRRAVRREVLLVFWTDSSGNSVENRGYVLV